MWLFVLAVVLGAIVGRLRGGSLSSLSTLPVRSISLLLLGTAAAVVPGLFGVGGWLLEWASFGLLAAFAVRNVFLVGVPIFLVGLVLNFAAVALNGGMPVRDTALVGAGLATHESVGNLDLGPRRHLAADDDVLIGLSDIIPIPALHAVVSFGDLIMAAGLANVVTAGTRARRRPTDERVPLLEPEFVAAARAATRPDAPSLAETLSLAAPVTAGSTSNGDRAEQIVVVDETDDDDEEGASPARFDRHWVA